MDRDSVENSIDKYKTLNEIVSVELEVYENIISDIDELENKIIKLKDAIDIFKRDIKIIINKLIKVITN